MLKRLLPFIASFCLAAPLSAADKKIVLIAGTPSHGPGEHEFNAGVLLLRKCLAGVPGAKVEEHRNGWPKQPAALDGADAVVIYCDGGGGLKYFYFNKPGRPSKPSSSGSTPK